MITSDTQLESEVLTPAPSSGAVQKDDLDTNASPSSDERGGVAVLDGELEPSERPNVNAMRDALETQAEMETGMLISEKEEELEAKAKTILDEKNNGAGGVEVRKNNQGGGTQIIINIAGKRKKLEFSSPTSANEFIKGASAKFGDKFHLVAAELVILKPGDHIKWHLHQFSAESRQGTVLDVLPKTDDGSVIFDAKQEDLMGNPKEGEVWGYMGLVYEINGRQVRPVEPYRAEFEVVQAKTGASLFEGKTDKETHQPEIVKGNWIDTPQHRGFSNYPGIYVLLPGSNSVYGNTEGGFQSADQAEAYNREFCGGKGKVKVQVDGKQATMAPQQDLDNDKPVTSGTGDINAAAPTFKEAAVENPSLCDPCIQWYRTKKRPLVMLTGFGTPEQAAKCDRCGRKATLAICKVEGSAADTRYINAGKKAFRVIKEHSDGTRTTQLQPGDRIRVKKVNEWDKWLLHVGDEGTVVKYSHPSDVKQRPDSTIHFVDIQTDKMKAGGWGVASVPQWELEYIGPEPVAAPQEEKVEGSLPPEESKLCWQLQRELGISYGEVVKVWLQFSGQQLKQRYESTRHQLLENEATMPKSASGMNFSPSNVPSQVVQEFYPELQHEIISYPNVTNAPMVNPELSGDPHELGTAPAEGIGEAVLQIEDEGGDGGELLPGALEDAFDHLTIVSYVSTSPAGACGIGRDGKSQVLEGAPLRKENDIRGPMFTDEFYQNYQAVPGAALAALKEKVAGADEKKQFGLFLKRVMGEVAASFIAAFKVTSKMPMNKVPGVGEIQLAQIEQAAPAGTWNVVNTGSRVKYLMEKLTDSEIQDAINDAFAQGAVWHEAKEGGFVYEVFVRAETVDTESMILKYKFVTGTKEADE
jgi:hypothetical protein